jgi:hypothetical protein
MSLDSTFKQQLAMSHGVSASNSIADILLANLPGAIRIEKATLAEDRSGVDWWANMLNGDRVGIDCKVRSEDYSVKGKDDLALESWSVVERKIVGWSRDPNKRTDYILWLWTDTGRWCLVPFPMLCKVFGDKWESWRRTFKVARQRTDQRYQSECIFVPRHELWREIYQVFSGNPKIGADVHPLKITRYHTPVRAIKPHLSPPVRTIRTGIPLCPPVRTVKTISQPGITP